MVDIGAIRPMKKNMYRKPDHLVSRRTRMKEAADEVKIFRMEEMLVISSPFRKARPRPPSRKTVE
ncbi:hypothetical protein D3C75_1297730 [compost metagenome]